LEFNIEIEKVGLIGGVIAFGFLGLFLGPTLLATNYGPIREWNGDAPTRS
jgi:predicted PurR-regulated permease PerM